MTKTDLVDVVDDDTATELVRYEPVPVSGLFGTDDPELVITRAVKVADALERVLREKKLIIRIRSSEHVLVEGWTLLGSMLGVFPVLVWTRQPPKWKKQADYAIRSMAATRATSKALRQPLGFVMTMAGFDTTPAEEMPDVDGTATRPEPGHHPRPADPVGATAEQLGQIGALIRSLQECDPGTDWKARAQELSGLPANMLTRTSAEMLIEKLQAELKAQMPEGDGTS